MTDRSRTLHDRPAGPQRHARKLFAQLSRLRYGQLEVIGPDGGRFSFPGAQPGPDARVHLEDWDAGSALLSSDGALAEAYLQGRLHTPDLAALLTLVALNRDTFDLSRPWLELSYRFGRFFRTNRCSRSIHARYDIDSDFYQCWLDASMTYSCALFAGDFSCSIEDAQTAKYERILNLLGPRPDERLLEIGCGWGGFAEYAARTRGCNVHGICISPRQLAWAQERVRCAGLADRVVLALCDFREVEGKFDHVVSIEAYEAIGERLWPAYFETIARCLKPDGAAVIQAIVVAEDQFADHRRHVDFIRQHIYPGAMLASPAVLQSHIRAAGLEARSPHAFGADYAETLKRWRERLECAWPELASPRLDERFGRLWGFYLAYCEAGFRARRTDVMQLELSHAR